MEFHIDVAVVGSGFGGSVAALRLAEKGYRTVVLEKGKRYRPEDLPRSNWNLRRSFWLPNLKCHGIWGLHLLPEVLVLHGTGVGGGSLMYANTLFHAPDEVWDDPQWKELEDWRAVMPEHYATAGRMLGIDTNPRLGPADEALRKSGVRRGRADGFRPTRVGVFFGEPDMEVPDPYFGGKGPRRTGCTFCGACMVGCRVGAKNTLDRNYLHLAEGLGVRIEPETEVDTVEALPEGGYRVAWRRSTSLLFPQRGKLTARRVVLSAGVLGTVPILLRSRERGLLPDLPEMVGRVARTNSEALLGITSRSRTDLWEGIAITSEIRMDDVTHMEPVRFPAGSDVMLLLGTLMADGGPGPWRPLRWLGNIARHPVDFLRVTWPWGKARRSSVLLVMQTVDNRTRLHLGRRWFRPLRRSLTSRPEPGQPGIPAYIPIANRVAREMAGELDAVPQNTINDVVMNMTTTAHILGGCALATRPDRGVVDRRGQVFGHDGLHVIDGSVIGANLGVNPSLTITALAEWMCGNIPGKS